MTQRPSPWQSYRTISTQTAPPEQLVLMLYDGALKFLEQGLTGFNYTDPLEFNQTINNNVMRAHAIIHEMNVRLDLEKGGEAAQNFRVLYNYFARRLLEGNMKKKKGPIEEVLRLLRTIRDAWSEMLQNRQTGDVGTAAAAEGNPRLA